MNQPKRPLTQREIRKQKQRLASTKFVTIINRSGSQTIPIQLKAPKGQHFFTGEQTVPLYPRKMAQIIGDTTDHRLARR